MNKHLDGNDERPPGHSFNSFGAVATVLAVAFVAIIFAFWFRTPVRLGGDSAGYLADAERLRQGQLPSEGRGANVGYSAVIALSQLCGAGKGGVVGLQITVAAVAAVALFDIGRRLGGRWAGLIASATLAVNPDVIRWHTFLLTDSLYTSVVVLAVWAIHVATERKRSWAFALAIFVVVTAALLRPNGWLFPPVAVCYWSFRHFARRRATGVSLAIVVAFVVGVFVLLAVRPGLSISPVDGNFREGRVIWGYPPSYIGMPDDEANAGKGLVSVLGYVARHPAAGMKLMGLRVLAELAHVRPYYSTGHNLAIATALLPMYLMAVVGLFATRTEPLSQLLGAVIAGHVLITALTWADWDGRFLLYVLPLIGAFAACGFARLVERRAGGMGVCRAG